MTDTVNQNKKCKAVERIIIIIIIQHLYSAVKSEDTEALKYKSIKNQLRRATDKAREIWYKEQCDEIEKLDKEGIIAAEI